MSNIIKELGLKLVLECAYLFTNKKLIVFFYIDDIVILYYPLDINYYLKLRDTLIIKYYITDLKDLKWFLGIRVLRDTSQNKIWLVQDSYISKIAEQFHLEGTSAPTPMSTEPLLKYEGVADNHQKRVYQQKVGSINYSAVSTRPDAAYTSQRLLEHLLNPGPVHYKAADRVILYLNGTKDLALEYGGTTDTACTFESGTENTNRSPEDPESPLEFKGYSDASFADDVNTRRSTQGIKFELFKGTTDWKVTKQKGVTKSTTEAELGALSSVAD